MLTAVLLAAGAGVRLYACWCFRHHLNLDAGVVALMTKHMAEGSAFPVFFYGQPHMGSLEALFGALFARWFGLSGVTVCLGTAWVSFWLLPIVYRWAREAGGRFAGNAALAFVVIGPGGFFHYAASPRGGYAAALTLGALVLWRATRMAVRWRRGDAPSALDFLLLGLAAGLAWWSSQLTAAAIGSAALLLLLVLRRGALTWRLGAGAGGFLLGGAPFWIFNVLHGWPSLAFQGSFGRVPWTQGLAWFFTDRFMSLMLPTPGPSWWRFGALAVYVGLALGSLFLLVLACRRKEDAPAVTLLGLLLFTFLFASLYAGSHFAAIATPRYFLPMVAPLAVLLGLATARLARRLPAPAACLPLLFLVALQGPVLAWATTFEKTERHKWDRLQHVAGRLEEHGLDAIYAPNVYRSWNFALRERFVFADLENDFYRPNALRAEWSSRPAVLGNYGGVAGFLRTAGGKGSVFRESKTSVHFDFFPPRAGWTEHPPAAWRSLTDEGGRDVREALADGCIDTGWDTPDDGSLTLALRKPLALSGFRMLARHPKGYPFRWSLAGRTPEGAWITLFEEQPHTRFFWSGPRLYWGGPYQRMEVRFEPRELTHLRIAHHRQRDDWNWSIHSLQVFGPAGEALPPEEEALDDLLRLLRRRTIHRLYADRWAANEVYRRSGGDIRTSLDPLLFPGGEGLPPSPVVVSPGTALLTRREDAAWTRRILEAREAAWKETALGPWVLFDGWPDPFPRDLGLQWAGFGPLRSDGQWATLLTLEAEEILREGGDSARAAGLLERALAFNPLLYAARATLPGALRAAGFPERAADAERMVRAISEPDRPAFIRFANGVEFLGYTLDPRSARAGETVRMTCFWRTPPDLPASQYAVFVHFRREGVLFQDDHIYLSDLPASLVAAQPGPPVLAVTRTILLPADLSPGPTSIVIGMLDRRDNSRLRAATERPSRKQAVLLPGALTVP